MGARQSIFRASQTARWASTDGTKRTGLGLRSRRRNCQGNSIHKAAPPTTRLRTATIRISAMPWLSNAIIGGSACPDASPMKRSPTTIGTPVTWQSDYLTGVESVAYAYQVGRATSLNDRRPSPTSTPRPRHLYQEPTLLPISRKRLLIEPAPLRRCLSEAPCLAHRTITDAAWSMSALHPTATE